MNGNHLCVGLFLLTMCQNGFCVDPPTLPPGKTAAILFGGNDILTPGFELVERLHGASFSLNVMPSPGMNEAALSWDELKKYNVLILSGLGKSDANLTLSANNKINQELLLRFVSEGGGIFYIPNYYQMRVFVPPQEAFGQAISLLPHFAEIPFDPETSVKATPWKIDFAHTENIDLESPLCAGVKSFWYPVATRTGSASHTTICEPGKEWSILIRGSRTSHTRTHPSPFDLTTDVATLPEGRFKSEIPLAACRSYGKGRIVYFAVSREYLINSFGLTTLERIVFDGGLRGEPSGGYQFLSNSLAWLAEPSLQEGNLGGATTAPSLLVNPRKVKFCEPYPWPQQEATPAAIPSFDGLIGARTRYSSGKGTPEEWVSAARKAGLSYLVFLEEASSMRKEDFEKLRKDCQAITAGGFAAIPGLTFDDETGNHYFYFGNHFGWPDEKYLKRNVLISYDPGPDPANPYQKGQLAGTAIGYTYTDNGFKLTAGNYLYRKSAAPVANWFGCVDASAVVTLENGKLVEDATAEYLKLIDAGQAALPLAVNIVDDPARIKQGLWKTVLRLPKAATNPIEEASQIARYWDDWQFYPDSPTRVYVSDGPRIVNWSFTGPRDYVGENRGNFVWQNYRWKVWGTVQAENGLKEVAVYDGEELFRGFDPAGQKEFTFSLELTHDKQHNLVLTAIDSAGRKAISSEQIDRNHRLEEFNCTDRNNQLSYGYSINKAGEWVMTGGNQGLSTPNKKIHTHEISPAGTFKNDPVLGAPAFDGGVSSEPALFATLSLQRENSEIQAPTACEAIRLFHTGDVNVGEGRYEHLFTDQINVYNVWHTMWKTEPATEFTAARRNYFFNIDPDSPLAVFLWRIRVDFKRDQKNSNLAVLKIDPREAALWACRSGENHFLCGTYEAEAHSRNRTIKVPMGRNSYLAALHSPMGGAAVFPLTDGLTAEWNLPSTGPMNLILSGESNPFLAGQSREVDLLLLGIPRATEATKSLPAPSTEVVERFQRDFGLDGGSGTYQVVANQGRINGRRYLLEIDGEEEACFSGTLSGDLISSLPVVVSGADGHSAFLYDRILKQARPLGVFENKAWAMVCLHGKQDLFIGHPVVVEQKSLTVQVTQTGDNSWSVEIHNPTDAPVTSKVRLNPNFDPFHGKTLDESATVPPRQSLRWSL